MRSEARGISVALEGPSGVGKSTLARILGRRPGAARIEEAWDRLRPQPSLELGTRRGLLTLERRLLETEATRYAEARALADEGRVAWMDTGTLGPLTYSAGLAWLTGGALDVRGPLFAWATRAAREGRWGVPELIVHLDLPPAQIVARGIRTGRHPPGLLARHLLVARFEKQLYRAEIARALPGRVLAVSARGSPEELASSVERQVLSRIRRPPLTPRELRSVLRAVQRKRSPW